MYTLTVVGMFRYPAVSYVCVCVCVLYLTVCTCLTVYVQYVCMENVCIEVYELFSSLN